jgi:hypothetical protein
MVHLQAQVHRAFLSIRHAPSLTRCGSALELSCSPSSTLMAIHRARSRCAAATNPAPYVSPNVWCSMRCCCCYLCSSFSVFARLRGGVRTHIRHRRPRGQLQRAPSPVAAHAKCAGGRRHENGTHRVPPRLRGRSGPVRHLRWLQ